MDEWVDKLIFKKNDRQKVNAGQQGKELKFVKESCKSSFSFIRGENEHRINVVCDFET